MTLDSSIQLTELVVEGLGSGAALDIPGGRTLTVTNTLFAAGPITVNSDGDGPTATLQFGPAALVLGSIVLGGVLSSNAAGLSQPFGGAPAVLGPGSLVTGRGSVLPTLSVRGSIDPDRQIDLNAPFEPAPTSTLTIDLGGTAGDEFDRVTGSGNHTLGGTLAVNIEPQYRPRFGDVFDVLSGSSVTGVFDTVIFGQSPPLLEGEVVYEPGRVRVFVSCDADVLVDGVLAFSDVTDFIAACNAGEERADITGDGEVNFGDITTFIAAFNAGCIDL